MGITQNAVSKDTYAMWRALFAFALADGNLSLEERGILSHHMEDEGFSEEQLAALRSDMNDIQDVEKLFLAIESEDNQKRFCALARTLVWCDGDISLQEKKILQNVNCFEKTKYKKFLKDSAGHTLYKNFAKLYETASEFQNNNPHSIFEAAA